MYDLFYVKYLFFKKHIYNVGEGREEAGMCVFGGDATRLRGAKWMIYALL